ncbi:hypothetical protein FPOA_03488 [Fusarium poae]|uniref:Uncharacterized protein n=1 Tax=Fusarium poae TaxID=36050 RepID=A0A1B8BA03_FUSPO|nr:hypothetical protein FPOA_03488 [Fusarium poae]
MKLSHTITAMTALLATASAGPIAWVHLGSYTRSYSPSNNHRLQLRLWDVLSSMRCDSAYPNTLSCFWWNIQLSAGTTYYLTTKTRCHLPIYLRSWKDPSNLLCRQAFGCAQSSMVWERRGLRRCRI